MSLVIAVRFRMLLKNEESVLGSIRTCCYIASSVGDAPFRFLQRGYSDIYHLIIYAKVQNRIYSN